jgi:hypothetical protein
MTWSTSGAKEERSAAKEFYSRPSKPFSPTQKEMGTLMNPSIITNV